MGTSAKQRRATYRKRLKERGLTELSVTLDEKTLATLRQLSKTHGVKQADVIRLGILTANRWLAEGGSDD